MLTVFGKDTERQKVQRTQSPHGKDGGGVGGLCAKQEGIMKQKDQSRTGSSRIFGF